MDIIMVKDCLKKDDLNTTDDNWENLVSKMTDSLNKTGCVEINFEGVERLTPSLAYNTFGRLVDSFGKDVLQKIKITNDHKKLSSRIEAAINKRHLILQEERRGSAAAI